MKRTITFLSALLIILIPTVAIAQRTQRPALQNQRPGSRQPMNDQQMGVRPGMTMMNRMQGRGMGMMNGGGMRGGNRMQGNRSLAGGDDFFLNMRGRLDLDDAQVEKLRQIRIDLVKTTGDLETDLEVARLELQDLLDVDDPNMNAIEDTIGNIHDAEAKLETARLRARFDAQNVLTPEQREQLQAPRGRGMMRNAPEPEE